LIYEMFHQAVEQETLWSTHILGDGIVWINAETTATYTKWLANNRLSLIGLAPLYPEVLENPYKHLERLQDNNGEKSNFFESTVTNYTQSSSMKGNWDF
jgi:ribonucleoside-diphosphate reductase beta chain